LTIPDHNDLEKIMRYLFLMIAVLNLAACGPSAKERQETAILTCNILAESRGMDAAFRIKEINSARKHLGEEKFLQTDATIRESFEWGLCKELVLDDVQYSEKLAGKRAAEAERLAEERAARRQLIGQEYLYINAQKPGVKVMPSGLQFEIIESGEGRSPLATSNVVTHYHGTFVNGDVFDSSVDRGTPAEFPVNGVIKGWTEALKMMKEGDKWRLVVPPEIAYGERGAAGGLIAPNTVLEFEVELIEVKD
jgi:FKBP-type peptidyl-prolyl cis-trans isomerase FklB